MAILYLCFGGIIMSTNLMRNTIAIMIFINAIKYIDERKPIQFFLLCILAITFHLSALMYLPTYFFLHKESINGFCRHFSLRQLHFPHTHFDFLKIMSIS